MLQVLQTFRKVLAWRSVHSSSAPGFLLVLSNFSFLFSAARHSGLAESCWSYPCFRLKLLSETVECQVWRVDSMTRGPSSVTRSRAFLSFVAVFLLSRPLIYRCVCGWDLNVFQHLPVTLRCLALHFWSVQLGVRLGMRVGRFCRFVRPLTWCTTFYSSCGYSY